MLELMYASGLRCSEVANLQVSDIDFNQMVVLVHGKGGKDRYVPFHEYARDWLVKYINESVVICFGKDDFVALNDQLKIHNLN